MIEAIQRVLMLAGLAGYAICFFAIVAIWALANTKREARKAAKNAWWENALFGSMLVSTIFVAGSKPIVSLFSFAAGLKDDGSYATTNGFVHIEWIKTGVPYVPNSATVYIDCREIGSTNEWTELGEAPVYVYRVDLPLANATNYNFNVWWHDDSEDVHTNGVWAYTLMNSKTGNPGESDKLDAVPVKAEVVGDGTIISTPSKKGKPSNVTR